MSSIALAGARVFIITTLFFFFLVFKSGFSFAGLFGFWQYAVI